MDDAIALEAELIVACENWRLAMEDLNARIKEINT